MNYDVYSDLYIKESYSIFEFLSIGPRGVIPKRIAFVPTEYPEIYNLIFGDIDVNGEINDYSISNNNDRNKVLATIAHAVSIYLKAYPERWIYFTGSTEARTRLYRMAINVNLTELESKFAIYARRNDSIIPFEKNMQLDGILIKIKP